MAGVANAVAAGIGRAPLSTMYFEDPVFKDVLTPVLTSYPLREPTVYLVYVSRKHVPLKLRTFIDFWREHVGESRRLEIAAADRSAPARSHVL